VMLAISAIVGAILHFWLDYYVTPGLESYFGKLVVGYIGGWLSPWVLGKWFPAISYGNVDIISAARNTGLRGRYGQNVRDRCGKEEVKRKG
jgi:hypothetical protein